MSLPRLKTLPLILLIATGCCVFGRLATARFVAWDDPEMVFKNPQLNPPSLIHTYDFWRHGYLGLYTPLPYTAWSVIAAIDDEPLGLEHGAAMFHVFNILLHIGTSVLVFALLRELTTGPWPAWVGAMVFLIHPLQVEPAGWGAGINNLMFGFFAMAAIWQYVVYVKTSSRLRFVIATVFYSAALLCKPIAVVEPLIVNILDHWELTRSLKQIAQP